MSNTSHALYHLVRADFLERVRRYSFLVTLGFAVYLGVTAGRGQISLRLGEYIGSPNSPWVGTLMSLTTSVFLSLIGFYIVSNSIHRDQQTHVGSILAATPMSRFTYTIAKALSNFAVLAAMVVILAVAGVAIVLIRGAAPLELWPLLAPFLFIALPAMALVAAIGVFFEATPILRTFGSFLYFFLWIFSLASTIQAGRIDPVGMHLVSSSMTAGLQAMDPNYKQVISFGFIVGNVGGSAAPKTFVWQGIQWTGALMIQQLLWFPIAAAIALMPALWFHRFDPAREGITERVKSKRKNRTGPQIDVSHPELASPALDARPPIQPSQLTVATGTNSVVPAILVLFVGELRLLAARRRWWIYAIGGGLMLASFLVPLAYARHGLVAAIWILPLLIWSRLGAREDLFSTRALIFSAPQAALRPLLASWVAAGCLPLALSSGIWVRLAFAGEFKAAASLVIGAFFAVSLALALGSLSRTPKVFEAVYMMWWYAGPLQGNRDVDFVGVSNASAQPLIYAALTLLLILAAWGIRELRLIRA